MTVDQVGRLGHRLLRRLGDEQREDDGDGEEREGDGIGHRRANAVEQAARHRPGDHSDLPRRRGERDGARRASSAGTRLGISDCWRRIEEGAGDAEGEEHREDLRDPDLAGEREDQRSARAQRPSMPMADRDDEAAVEAVGRGAGDEDEEQRRRELDEADEPEVEGVAGQVIDLPADGDADDLGGIGGGEPRHKEAREAAMAERCPGRLGRCGVGRGHGDS